MKNFDVTYEFTRQAMYALNVTLWHVCVTIAALETQQCVSHCQQHKNTECYTTILRRIYVAGDN
jgi:hypothetical protein